MIKRILILSHDNKIGDAIVATGLLKPLRAHWPDCEVGILCGPSNVELYRHHPAVKWLHITASRNVFARIWSSVKARLKGYDAVVHFGLDVANPSLKIVLSIINAKQRFLFLAPPGPSLPNEVVMNGDWQNLHYSARHQRFLEALGVSAGPYRYDICLGDATSEFKKQPDEFLLVINSQSSTDNRSLPIWWLREFVATALKQHCNMHIQLLSASATHETEQRHAFAHFDQRVSVTRCQPSISQSLAVIKTADLVLSPDTYAVHAAGAWNIPVIALYEPSSTTMNLWGPVSDRYIQICAPAGKTVSAIGIQEVSDALTKLLETALLRERVQLT